MFVNRIGYFPESVTVKAHDIGRRFGEAVREVCKEKGLLTDIEIGDSEKSGNAEELIGMFKDDR